MNGKCDEVSRNVRNNCTCHCDPFASIINWERGQPLEEEATCCDGVEHIRHVHP